VIDGKFLTEPVEAIYLKPGSRRIFLCWLGLTAMKGPLAGDGMTAEKWKSMAAERFP
jgi:hypothetical protein